MAEKVVQLDSKCQLVVPKAIRSAVGAGPGTAFWVSVSGTDIVLQRIDMPKKGGKR